MTAATIPMPTLSELIAERRAEAEKAFAILLGQAASGRADADTIKALYAAADDAGIPDVDARVRRAEAEHRADALTSGASSSVGFARIGLVSALRRRAEADIAIVRHRADWDCAMLSTDNSESRSRADDALVLLNRKRDSANGEVVAADKRYRAALSAMEVAGREAEKITGAGR